MLGKEPDWDSLDPYQRTMTREEFVESLETIYLPYGFDEELIQVFPGYAQVRKDSHRPDDMYRIDFLAWRDLVEESTLEQRPDSSPLDGLVIAIDPGHIGGDFSEMEGRHFQMGSDAPVKEGDLTLAVAKKLESRLKSMGVNPLLLRQEN